MSQKKVRRDGRTGHQVREIKLTPDYIKNVPGSALIEQGDTRVLCTATYESRVPFFLKNSDRGWVKAEYSMLPGSTGNQRVMRERQRVNNRHIEIQRLLGRSFRTVFNLKAIRGMTISIDADVLQADGGTRCAAVNCGMVTLVKTLKYLVFETLIPDFPAIKFVAAVSIGLIGSDILVDLNYKEDVEAGADINIVSNEDGDIIEVQALAEESTIPAPLFRKVMEIGVQKNLEIIDQLKKYV